MTSDQPFTFSDSTHEIFIRVRSDRPDSPPNIMFATGGSGFRASVDETIACLKKYGVSDKLVRQVTKVLEENPDVVKHVHLRRPIVQIDSRSKVERRAR